MKTKHWHHARAARTLAQHHERRQPGPAGQPLDVDSSRGVGRSDHDARVWRESCRDARAATRKQKAAIREAWRAWLGPATVACFRFIVDVHTGALELRRQAAQASVSTWSAARAAEADAAVRAEATR